MKNKMVYVDYLKLRRDFDVLKDIFGTEGFCYIDNDLIYKIYFSYLDKEFDFSIFKSPYISFPINYLYDRNFKETDKVVGEIMPYFDKKDISTSISNDVLLSDIKKHSVSIIEEIKKFPNIQMNDLCWVNLLYNEEGFSIIDTTSWIITDKDVSEYNIKKFYGCLSWRIALEKLGLYNEILKNEVFINNLLKIGAKGKELMKVILAIINNDYQVLPMIDLYQEIALKDDYGDIKTVGDMENYTKKLKKG